MTIIDMSPVDERGVRVVRYVLDSEIMSSDVRVAEAKGGRKSSVEMADPSNIYHVAAPSNGDMWVMHVQPGDFVKKGEELFNISIMNRITSYNVCYTKLLRSSAHLRKVGSVGLVVRKCWLRSNSLSGMGKPLMSSTRMFMGMILCCR